MRHAVVPPKVWVFLVFPAATLGTLGTAERASSLHPQFQDKANFIYEAVLNQAITVSKLLLSGSLYVQRFGSFHGGFILMCAPSTLDYSSRYPNKHVKFSGMDTEKY